MLPAPDPDWVRLGWDVLQAAMLAGLGLYQYIIARDSARKTQIQHLEDRVGEQLDAHERRITRNESAIQHAPRVEMCQLTSQRIARLEQAHQGAPTHKDLTGITDQMHEGLTRTHQRMDRMEAAISTIGGELAAQTRLLQTIDGYLREHPHRAGD